MRNAPLLQCTARSNSHKHGLLHTAWRHRSLIWELTKREFSARYKGSLIGIGWNILQPLFLLTVYTLAFGVILKTQWNTSSSTYEYALTLFAGLIVFNAFTDTINKSVESISGNPNFVKKIVFPLELLPAICVATALLQATISLTILIVAYSILTGIPNLEILMAPLVLVCIAPALLGLSWLLSAAGVVIRDTRHMSGMLTHTLLFLTPVFYSIEMAPAALRKMLAINPLTFPIEEFRSLIFSGASPSYPGLLLYFLSTSLFAFVSLTIFRRLRANFADLV